MGHFSNIAGVDNPGPEQLASFVLGVEAFLGEVISGEEFLFLWGGDPKLRTAAKHILGKELNGSFESLQSAVLDLGAIQIESHGLSGVQLQFKLRVIDLLTQDVDGDAEPALVFVGGGRAGPGARPSGGGRGPGWLVSAFGGIDALLDSLIDATATGGAIKEFKDILTALAERWRGPKFSFPWGNG